MAPAGFCPGQSPPVGEDVGLGLGDGDGVGDGVGVAEGGGPVVGGPELGGGENAGVVADEDGRGDRVGGNVGTDDGVGAGSSGSTGCACRAGNSEPIGSRAGTLGRATATAGGLGAAAGGTSGRGTGPSRPRVKYRTNEMPAAAGMSTSPASRSRVRPKPPAIPAGPAGPGKPSGRKGPERAMTACRCGRRSGSSSIRADACQTARGRLASGRLARDSAEPSAAGSCPPRAALTRSAARPGGVPRTAGRSSGLMPCRSSRSSTSRCAG